jgi:AraC family transcriptional regulator
LAKIAVELQQAVARREENGDPGHVAARMLAKGDGWTVADVVCTSGPRDRAFEEQHSHACIVIVVAGSFQYRAQSPSGPSRELMTPGSLLLGSAGQCYECGHQHGAGDRCLSFWYAPDYFERLAGDAGARGRLDFRVLRVPPLRALSPVVARASAALTGQIGSANEGPVRTEVPWEELSLQLAAQTIQVLSGLSSDSSSAPPSAEARVTRAVRKIDRHPGARLTLGSLAREAGLSEFHFLRTFEGLTGLTPHQYVLRARLREAATRLAVGPAKVLDIVLDCGFGDVSNFNRAFRTEFGVSPRVFRAESGRLQNRRSQFQS